MKLVKIWFYVDGIVRRDKILECWSGIKRALRDNDIVVDSDIENVEMEDEPRNKK